MSDNNIPEIYEKASEAVFDRADKHGGEDNFDTIAAFWSDYLDIDVAPKEVADLMVLMKVARSKDGSYTGDDYTDMCGYAYHGDRLSKEEQDPKFGYTTVNKIEMTGEITVGDIGDMYPETEECWTQFWCPHADYLPTGNYEHIFIQAPEEEAEQFAHGLFTDVSDHDIYEYETLEMATSAHRHEKDMSVEEFADLESVLVVDSDELERRLMCNG